MFLKKRKIFDTIAARIGLISILGLFVSFFVGCAEENDPEIILYPDSGLVYGLFPNDEAANDSASANLAHGVRLIVHPGVNYELSFDKGGSMEAPKLQLFRLYINRDSTGYNGKKVRELSAKEINGRYVYSFVCEENDKALWATSLEQNGSFYRGSTNKVKLVGDGPYSDHFSINFIVVGKIKETSDGVDTETLGKMILAEFRKIYSSVTIDTLYIRHADEHPTLGKLFPSNEPWIAGKSSESLYLTELGGWPEKELFGALDIVYVHRIERNGIMGYSGLFSSNLGGGEQSTVIIGNTTKAKTSSGEIPLSSEEIVTTALHETGHFFGLRHTTTTSEDMDIYMDGSIYEDGIEDTPYCKEALMADFAKVSLSSILQKHAEASLPVNGVERKSFAATGLTISLKDCPDANNTMFPWSSGTADFTLSKKQLEIVCKNLMLFPH